ncbi:MAG: ATP-binding protein [Kiritimatiellae bacterium]|nr:ATP-binding protein [Kiritimatiellia bacterium]
MKFFGRKEEIAELRRSREISHRFAQFTVITGRRRVGKTELIKEALRDGTDDFVYLLITRQAEKTLCTDLQRNVAEAIGHRLTIHGECSHLIELVGEIFKAAKEKPLTLVIDELQEMDRINPSFFGALQGLWDEQHNTAKINLVVSGSVNRLMNKVFFTYGAPLYGRNTGHLKITPFPVSLLKEIFTEFHPGHSNGDLLALWTFTGGVARYVELLMTSGAYTLDDMIDAIFGRLTAFVEEGKLVLMEEFGNEYATYFSILSAIASGHTRFAEIETELGMEVGTYIANLNERYELISRTLPIFAKKGGKNSAYHIDDCFFRFWFRFVFRYQALISLGRRDALCDIVRREFSAFSGYALERYFRCKIVEESSCTAIGSWWDRKGENEIDIVCENDIAGTIDFYEVKSDRTRYRHETLERKMAAFFEKHPEKRTLRCSAQCLSIVDM